MTGQTTDEDLSFIEDEQMLALLKKSVKFSKESQNKLFDNLTGCNPNIMALL